MYTQGVYTEPTFQRYNEILTYVDLNYYIHLSFICECIEISEFSSMYVRVVFIELIECLNSLYCEDTDGNIRKLTAGAPLWREGWGWGDIAPKAL